MLPASAHIGSATLVVSDLDRSLAFYQDILGFREHRREGRTAFLGADGSRDLIVLEELTGAMPRPRRSAGLFHVAILVPSRAALGRSLIHLVQRGWSLTGVADHLVSEALYLNDADGLGLEIYRDRPRSEWREQDGQIIMGTEGLDLDDLASEPGAEDPWRGLEFETVIGHVHLQVSTLESAEALYCDRFGFTPMLRRYHGALFVAAGGYHHHVGLNVWAGVGVPPPPANAVGLKAFTIESSGNAGMSIVDESTRVEIQLR